ncbi:hypothetical protein Csa_005573 [Cucumis sativus]|uniref:Uncharacterized protein n=1 Tax=Cucumis sativus TaxID=3659 RepID=A0A0A0KAU6_CUCSA|nr:hypothetical protein Csa_005573 [Cucumis sativus]
MIFLLHLSKSHTTSSLNSCHCHHQCPSYPALTLALVSFTVCSSPLSRNPRLFHVRLFTNIKTLNSFTLCSPPSSKTFIHVGDQLSPPLYTARSYLSLTTIVGNIFLFGEVC